ncbi:DUF1190 domain-containing protein [Sulfitobacter sp. R18_1]|uniref:DUF1190 domain-containing protein n=1 Tax=Sulfitobacter sp. R18_1 TaxID=2821104 RepID=UPI001ADC1FFB|nr:DUF1190 domain-containing protein [Sulfitobacter sp. R18_1]MBO9428507.1 DUF1190 domain-containing protein [Sulfitobacter sp. R18_1]
MKQNKIIRRTIVGSSAFAMAVSLAACEDKRPEASMFSSVEQCKENAPEGAFDWVSQCNEAFKQAEVEHAKLAPRYDSLEVCEAQHGTGKCGEPEVVTGSGGGGSFFMPFMMGYMVSNMFNSGSSSSSYSGRPVYSSASGKSYFTSDGKKAGSSFASKPFKVNRSVTKTPSLSKPPKVLTKTSVKRTGGFGSTRTVSSRSGGRVGG